MWRRQPTGPLQGAVHARGQGKHREEKEEEKQNHHHHHHRHHQRRKKGSPKEGERVDNVRTQLSNNCNHMEPEQFLLKQQFDPTYFTHLLFLWLSCSQSSLFTYSLPSLPHKTLGPHALSKRVASLSTCLSVCLMRARSKGLADK